MFNTKNFSEMLLRERKYEEVLLIVYRCKFTALTQSEKDLIEVCLDEARDHVLVASCRATGHVRRASCPPKMCWMKW